MEVPDPSLASGLWTMLEHIYGWSDWARVRGLQDKTVDSYEWYLSRFMLRCSRIQGYPVTLDSATEDDVVAYLSTLPAKGHSRGGTLRALKSYYKWALKRGHVREDPTAEIPVPRPRYSQAPTLEIEDIYRLFLAAWERHPRRAWALLLLYSTGGRITATCSLTPDDCKGGWVRFRVAKGGRDYRIPASDYAVCAISNLISTPRPAKGQPKDSVWRECLIGVGPGQLWSWVHEAGRTAGVRVHPHLLRHSLLTHLARDPGVDLRTWIAISGHSDASQFTRYAHPSEGLIRAAFSRLNTVKSPAH